MNVPRPTGGQVARVAALAALVGVLLVMFGPGSTTPDTLDMCEQAVRDLFNDWHAPIVAGAWGFVDLGLPWIFLGQVVVTVCAVRAILAAWLRPWLAVAATWAVVLFPATLGWMGHIGKDEWFAAATLSAVALLSRAGRARSARTRGLLVAAGVLACWVAVAARPNGILPIAVVLVVVLPARVPAAWRTRHAWAGSRTVGLVVRVAAAGVVALAILVTTTLWERVVVDPSPGYPMQVAYLYDLAGMSLRTGTVLLPDAALERPTTVEELGEVFEPGATNDYYFGDESPVRFGPGVYDAEQMAELQRAWRDAVLEHPGDYLATRLTYARMVTGWSMAQPSRSVVDPGMVGDGGYTLCEVPDRWAPGVNEDTLEVLRSLALRNIWRGWVFAVVLAAAAAVAGLVRVAEARGLAAAGLVSLGSVVLAGGTTTFRYSWFTALCAVIAVALALRRIPWCARRAASDAPVPDEDATGEGSGDDAVAGPAAGTA